MKDKQPVKGPLVIEERLGKENLSNIASTFENPRADGAKVDKEKITLVDKEQYSSVKNKFEHLNDEVEPRKDRRSVTDLELPPGAENLADRKSVFEKLKDQEEKTEDRKRIEIERSEADRKRVKEKFFEAKEKEEPRECAVCGKMVYSVEKLLLEKRVYHKACFKCQTCQKALSVQGYSTHEGKLYCKLHIMEIYRPEVVSAREGSLEADMLEPEDEEDYVLVTKPKVLDPSVVRSGFKTTDDLENVPKLQNMKARWEEPTEQTKPQPGKRAEDADVLIPQGKVKSRLSKFIEGADTGEHASEEEAEEAHDPNVIRNSKKKREKIRVQVDAKSIKSKWETGAVENAHVEIEDRSQELEEVKRNVSVKGRYKERDTKDEVVNQRRPVTEEEQLDTSFTKTAKEKFLRGESFQENTTEKPKEEIHFAEMGKVKQRFEKGLSMDESDKTERPTVEVIRSSEMGNIKATFEQGKAGDSDAKAELKRQKIVAEFKRIKREQLIMQEKERREAEENGNGQESNGHAEEIRPTADLQSIKKSFEEGKAFQRDENGNEVKQKRIEDALEIKVAGKARQKFKQIDQEVPKDRPQDFTNRPQQDTKWPASERVVPEPVNRRGDQGDDRDENPEEYELKNLLNKFKNMEQQAGKEEPLSQTPKAKRQITPPPESYRAEIESAGSERDPTVVSGDPGQQDVIRVPTKSMKEKWEKGPEALGVPEGPTADEKRKQLEEEFKKIKEMKKQQSQEISTPEEPAAPEQPNPDLALTAGRAQKARAKWDKLQRKEAKKAEKAAKRAAATAKEPHKDAVADADTTVSVAAPAAASDE